MPGGKKARARVLSAIQAGPLDPAAEPAAEAEGGTDTNKGQRRGGGGDVRLTKAILKTVERPIGAGLDIPFILDI